MTTAVGWERKEEEKATGRKPTEKKRRGFTAHLEKRERDTTIEGRGGKAGRIKKRRRVTSSSGSGSKCYDTYVHDEISKIRKGFDIAKKWEHRFLVKRCIYAEMLLIHWSSNWKK